MLKYVAIGLIGFLSQGYVAVASIIGCYKGVGNRGYSKLGIVIPFLIGAFLRNDVKTTMIALIAWLLCFVMEMLFDGSEETTLFNRAIQGAFCCMISLVLFFAVSGFNGVKNVVAISICAVCTGVMIYLVNFCFEYYGQWINKLKDRQGGKAPSSLCDRLNSISNSIGCFVKAFDEVAVAQDAYDDYEPTVNTIFNRVSSKVCCDCSRNPMCWDAELNEACQGIIQLVEILAKKKFLKSTDLPAFLRDKCEHKERVVFCTGTAIEVLQTEELWKDKIRSEKEVMKKQMSALGNLIKGISQDIGEGKIALLDLEDSIEKALNKFSNQVLAYGWMDKKGRLEIELKQKNREVFDLDCEGAAQAMSKITNKDIVFDSLKYRNSRDIYAKFIEKSILSVATGVSAINKEGEEVSGDSFTYSCIKNGIFLAGLCDGMGTGENAALASHAAISMIEGLIEGGIDMETAASFVNSALLMQSNGDIFVTLDVAVIDLYDGEAKFLKIGAAPTIVKKGSKGKWLFTNHLPAGIIADVEMIPETMILEKGDIVILMSDGVFEALLNQFNEKQIMDFINKLEITNPQMISDKILKKSLKNEKSVDDMSVMALRIY